MTFIYKYIWKSVYPAATAIRCPYKSSLYRVAQKTGTFCFVRLNFVKY